MLTLWFDGGSAAAHRGCFCDGPIGLVVVAAAMAAQLFLHEVHILMRHSVTYLQRLKTIPRPEAISVI